MTQFYKPENVKVQSGHFINGEATDGGDDHIDVIRPSDLSVQGTLANASQRSVDQAVQAAKTAFHQSGWATMPPRERADILRRWADLVDRDGNMAQLESCVSCQPYREVFMRDVRVVSGSLRF